MLISCVVTAQLISTFGFAYAYCWFSDGAAQILYQLYSVYKSFFPGCSEQSTSPGILPQNSANPALRHTENRRGCTPYAGPLPVEGLRCKNVAFYWIQGNLHKSVEKCGNCCWKSEKDHVNQMFFSFVQIECIIILVYIDCFES